jgi:omega-amidase
MKVVGLQFDLAWENKGANFATVERMLADSPPPAGSLVVLPEMFATGFSMNPSAIAEPPGGETEKFLAGLARRFGVQIVAGVARLGAGDLASNQALAFSTDGALVAAYAKRRLFSPGGEDQHYQPGRQSIAFEAVGCRVAPFVCYDLRFPELFREIAEARGDCQFPGSADLPLAEIARRPSDRKPGIRNRGEPDRKRPVQ